MSRLFKVLSALILVGAVFFAGMKFQQFADDDACLDAGGTVDRQAVLYCVK